MNHLGRYYNTAYNDWMITHLGKPITMYNVAAETRIAYQKMFISANIQPGF